jgi:cytochrome c553
MAADRVSACVSCHEEDSRSERANYGYAKSKQEDLTGDGRKAILRIIEQLLRGDK